ncbi:hypothetical protein AB0E44_08165 [Micrococcus terreus]|uniref:lipopolysaccharide biosynthesis protein n=1 Tax=Micrococcus terreus TaxID=574650 RepID=UPI00340B6206
MRGDLSGASWITFGTLFGQAVVFFATPTLASMYGPDAFGAAAIFLAVASVIAPLLTFRLELLLPTAGDGEVRWINRRANVLVITGATIFSVLYYFVFSPGWVASVAFWFAASSIAAGFITTQLLVRLRGFKALGVGKTANGVGQVGVQVPIGLNYPSFKGMEVGFAFGYVAAWAIQRFSLRAISSAATMTRSRKQAIFRAALKLTIAGLVNGLSVWGILFALTMFHSSNDVGIFSVVQRLVVTPAGLLTASLLPVVTGGIAVAVRSGSSPLLTIRRWLIWLAPAAVLVLLVLLLVPGGFLVAILGPEYSGADEYLRALAPMIAAQMIAGPLGQALVAMGGTTAQLIWDIVRFGVLVLTALVTGYLGADPVTMTAVMSAVYALCYASFVCTAYCMARVRK